MRIAISFNITLASINYFFCIKYIGVSKKLRFSINNNNNYGNPIASINYKRQFGKKYVIQLNRIYPIANEIILISLA